MREWVLSVVEKQVNKHPLVSHVASARTAKLLAALLSLFAALKIVRAEDLQGRSTDIHATLKAISSGDTVDQVLAVQDALNSEDPVVRSIVLEKSLASDDRRVRATAFAYLISVQKRFVVDTKIPEKALDDMKDTGLASNIALMELNTLEVKSYDKNTLQFAGDSSRIRGGFKGAIAQDGLTFIFNAVPDCKLQFPGAISGSLVGSFTCGRYSFVARSVLP